MLLLGGLETDAGLAQLHEALRLDPQRLTRSTPFVWLLATHPQESARRPDQARQLAERIVAATGRRDPGALDALAACYAALGRFDEAVTAARDALAVASRPDHATLRAAIADHLERFAQRQAIVMDR